MSGNGAPQDSIRINGSTNSFNVTNLQPSSNYTITISAVFVDGEEGSVSVSMTVRTLDVSCDPPCPFGGECVATPDTCDCSSIINAGESCFTNVFYFMQRYFQEEHLSVMEVEQTLPVTVLVTVGYSVVKIAQV